jgi:hypothetical protein
MHASWAARTSRGGEDCDAGAVGGLAEEGAAWTVAGDWSSSGTVSAERARNEEARLRERGRARALDCGVDEDEDEDAGETASTESVSAGMTMLAGMLAMLVVMRG